MYFRPELNLDLDERDLWFEEIEIRVGYVEDVVKELYRDRIEEGGYYTYYYACC